MGKYWVEQVKSGKKKISVDFLRAATRDKAGKKFVVKSLSGPIERHDVTVKFKAEGAANVGMVPPIQPLMVLLEGENINYEDFSRDFILVFAGTGGYRLDAKQLFEKFYYSEASQAHGTMLQKKTYQRNQARDFLASIQNLKTAIINIESDLEKMDEQLKGFQQGDWEQIKGLFIDNYGGPQRSWTAIARNVPLVRMAMTWFLRLKVKKSSEEEMPIKKFSNLKITERTKTEKVKDISKDLEETKKKLDGGAVSNKKLMLEEVDKLIKDEQVNPAIANYLKRKIEEFWNWVIDYIDWLTRTRNNIMSNLIQQKANLKLYMRWAADHIIQAERMEMKPEDVTDVFPEFNFKGAPKEILMSDYIFYTYEDARPDIYELCRPWVPVVLVTIVAATTIELQKKFMEMGFVIWYGYMRDDDLKDLLKLTKGGDTDLLRVMLESGALTKDELPKLFTPDEINEMQGGGEKSKHSFNDNIQLFLSKLGGNLQGIAGLFGLSLPKESLPWTRERRAASMAADLAMEGVRTYKKGKGMLIME